MIYLLTAIGLPPGGSKIITTRDGTRWLGYRLGARPRAVTQYQPQAVCAVGRRNALQG